MVFASSGYEEGNARTMHDIMGFPLCSAIASQNPLLGDPPLQRQGPCTETNPFEQSKVLCKTTRFATNPFKCTESCAREWCKEKLFGIVPHAIVPHRDGFGERSGQYNLYWSTNTLHTLKASYVPEYGDKLNRVSKLFPIAGSWSFHGTYGAQDIDQTRGESDPCHAHAVSGRDWELRERSNLQQHVHRRTWADSPSLGYL
eukprot:765142-Amphidinium_carterae.1